MPIKLITSKSKMKLLDGIFRMLMVVFIILL